MGGVIAWALTACYTGMENRLQKAKDIEDWSQVGLCGARVQKWLCALGAVVSAGVSIAVALCLDKKQEVQ